MKPRQPPCDGAQCLQDVQQVFMQPTASSFGLKTPTACRPTPLITIGSGFIYYSPLSFLPSLFVSFLQYTFILSFFCICVMSLPQLPVVPLAFPFLVGFAHAINYGGFDDPVTTTTQETTEDSDQTTKETKTDGADTETEKAATQTVSTNKNSGNTLTIDTLSASEVQLTYDTEVYSDEESTNTKTDQNTDLDQTVSNAYNQWGFTGSQSKWTENTATNTVGSFTTVVTESGNTYTLLVRSSADSDASDASNTQTTKNTLGLTSKVPLTVTLSGSSTALASTSSSGASKMDPVGYGTWKRKAALFSVVALTLGLHCI